jgi:hypothetical protein
LAELNRYFALLDRYYALIFSPGWWDGRREPLVRESRPSALRHQSHRDLGDAPSSASCLTFAAAAGPW